MAKRPRRAWRNLLTYTGGLLSALSLLFILNLLLLDLATPEPNPYLGLFTFLILPVTLLFGLFLIAAGLITARLRMWWRNGPGGEAVEYYPRVDLSLPSHRRAAAVAAGAACAVIPLVGFLSYQGYQYTDSNEFCGRICHPVMKPQYVAHQRSPHARVECATCHIGRGATWYVRSKLAGLRQVAAVLTNSYPRPIPPAIRELRPARETCERCHWPQKFYGNQLVTIRHFAADERSTPRPIRMLVKTGGNDPSIAPPSGVHWHMALGHTIEFIARDDALQDVPWVRATDHETGAQRIYRSDGLRSTDPPPEGTLWKMDCIACHNRATHVFRPPWKAADDAIVADPELRELPFAKRVLIEAVTRHYSSKEEGLHRVATYIEDYYLINYPDLAARRRALLDRLIAAGRQIYDLSTFPEMNVTWRTYPDNIGHKNFPGCFRCHDGKHVDDNGRPISHACSTCHTFLEPIDPDGPDSLIREGQFAHPIELRGKHAELLCSSCHDGGMAPAKTCSGCHELENGLRAAALKALEPFAVEPDAMFDLVECEDCHDLTRETSAEQIDRACIECHEEPKYKGMVVAWKSELDELFDRAAAVANPEEQRVLSVLREAGPLHNVEATRKILERITAGAAEAAARAAPEAQRQ
ncbi:MAG: hypothetical protein D6815_08650 [Candidatus Dadabacteria bacterium]|nr:MAG: hypothetical protein D6815_08650 [Candidatus Dadabacteria bacterium]